MKTLPPNAAGPRKRILIITLGADTGTSAHLFAELARVLSADHDCRRIAISLRGGSLRQRAVSILLSNFRHLRDVLWAEVVIVHVLAVLAVVPLIAARLLGRKIVIFPWDVYPTTIGGRRYMTGFARRAVQRLEGACLRMSDVIVLPSDDFAAAKGKSATAIFPLWPQSALTLEPVRAVTMPDGVCNIAFAGQINELRGLAECLSHLERHTRQPVVLHVFSADEVGVAPADPGTLRIEHHGRVSRDVLQVELGRMHFGLISLHPLLDQPGFPSKTFDYLAAGLPVLYFGRPLPGFTAPLTACGVGVDITTMEVIDLAALYRTLIDRLEWGRAEYLDFTRLDLARLQPLL